jgi:hypothetical protein
MSDMCVDRSLQKKMEKTTNQHARIPHIGKAGTPYWVVAVIVFSLFFTFSPKKGRSRFQI